MTRSYATTGSTGSGGGTVTNVTATSPITSSGGATPNISTSIATNKLLGRATTGTGVVEQITLGTNLSFTGTTLNAASGGSPGGSDGDLQINNSGSFGTIDGLTLDKTGDPRGTNSLDIQSSRSASTQVASGNDCVAVGIEVTAAGTLSGAFGMGVNNTNSGTVEVGASDTDKINIGTTGLNLISSTGTYLLNGSPFTAGITSINSDSSSTQSLIVGSSGSSFNIFDGGSGSHFFNLPTASASQTGQLNTTDWSNFNSKVSGASGSDGDIQINVSGAFGTVDGLTLDQTGDARGSFALDIQSHRSDTSQVASGLNSGAIGFDTTASGTYSFSFGYNNTASGDYSVAFGYGNTASTSNATSFGKGNTSEGDTSTAFGNSNTASGYMAVSFGKNNMATGQKASAFGFGNTASGAAGPSSAFGYNNTASGNNSSAFGFGNTASAYAGLSTAFGSNVTNTTANSVEIGPDDTIKVRIYANGINAALLPTSAGGLSSGDLWVDTTGGFNIVKRV